LRDGFAFTTPLRAALTGQVMPAGFQPSAAAAGRFDAGASLDLVVANGGTNTLSLYFNNGAGNFTAPVTVTVGNGPTAFAIADFNRDSFDDVAIGYANLNSITVLRNNGLGQFTPIEVPTGLMGIGPRSIAAADFNRDGYVDLATANQFSDTVSILLNNKSTGVGFADANWFMTANAPGQVDVGHFNGDAAPDLAVLTADNATIYLGNGAGAFSAAGQYPLGPGFSIGGAAAGDIDGDSFDDFAIISTEGSVRVLRGDGVGGLAESTGFIFPSSAGFDWVDYDQDGDLDAIAVVQDIMLMHMGHVVVKRNNGGGLFEPPPKPDGGAVFPPTVGENQIARGDFNGDGVIDFAAAWQNNQLAVGRVTVHFNQLLDGSHEVFIPPDGYPPPSTGRDFGMAPIVTAASRLGGDYNGDSVVNAADLRVWTANFGRTAGPGMAADGQQNTRVDGGDFLLWQRRLGSTIPAATPALAVASVAEHTQPGELFTVAQAWEQLSAATGVRGADSVAPHSADLGDAGRFAPRLPLPASLPATPARRQRLTALKSPDRAVLAANEDLAAFDAALAVLPSFSETRVMKFE
jgi:hypothetical protein